jgi:hypothetical protein
MNLLLGILRRAPDASRSRALRRFYRAVCRRDTAEARGKRLLRRWLSQEQRAQFDTMNFFDVVGSSTGKRYRILYGHSANIREMDEAGNPKMGWCFVPKGYLVPGDVMLAQKIALETDELAALAVANRFAPGPFSEPINHRAFWGPH